MKIIIISVAALVLGILGVNGQQQTACQGVPNDNFVNSPHSCASFFFCRDGQASQGHCPPPMLFHPMTQYCDFPDNVHCEQCSPFGVQHLPAPGSCVRFIACSHGVPINMECPAGQYFNRNTGGCDDPSVSDCFLDVCPPTNEVINVPHPENCYAYFTCYNGNPHRVDCAPGLRFNPNTRLCDFAHNVPCPGDPGGEVPPPGGEEPPPGGEVPPPGGEEPPPGGEEPPPGGEEPPPGGEEPPPLPPPGVSCDDRQVYIPHPTDCAAFFMCNNGIAHERRCPPGLLWNTIINMCDHSANVNC